MLKMEACRKFTKGCWLDAAAAPPRHRQTGAAVRHARQTETETVRRVMQHGTISSRPRDRFLALSNNTIQPRQTRHNPPLIVWPQEGKGCRARSGEEGKGTATRALHSLRHVLLLLSLSFSVCPFSDVLKGC